MSDVSEVFTAGELEAIDAIRDVMTATELATVITIARLTGKTIGATAVTYLMARDLITQSGAQWNVTA